MPSQKTTGVNPWRLHWAIGFFLFLVLGVSTRDNVEAGWVGKPAPEIGNEVWINSAPQTLAGLRGKVVLLEFWTYG